MGERAVTVFLQPSETDRGRPICDIYYAQWGGSKRVLSRALETDGPLDALTACSWQFRGSGPADRFLCSLDFLTLSAVYVLSRHGSCVLQPLWFGLPSLDGPCQSSLDGPRHPRLGALVRVDSIDGFLERRRSFVRRKADIQACIRASSLSAQEGLRLLLASVEVQWYSPALLWTVLGV